MASTVQIAGLVRRFAGSERPEVDGVSLDVGAGEVVSLVGPSAYNQGTKE